MTRPGIALKMHIGLGCGLLTSMTVGGVNRRWEYLVAGDPMTQVATGEALAAPGEIVVSPQAWQYLPAFGAEGRLAEAAADGHGPAPGPAAAGFVVMTALYGAAALLDEVEALPAPEFEGRDLPTLAQCGLCAPAGPGVAPRRNHFPRLSP